MKDGKGADGTIEATLPCGAYLAQVVEAAAARTVVAERPRPLENTPIARPERLLIVGLTLGAMAETMLYQNSLGIGVSLFVLCAVAGLIAVAHWESEANIRWRNVTPLTATVLFFAAMIAIRGGGLITALNIAFCLRLGTLLLGMFSRRDILQIGVGDLMGIPWQIANRIAVGAKPVIRAIELPGNEARQRLLLPTCRGLLLALPILAVVIALFSSADARFAEKVGEAARWVFPTDYWDRILRVAFVLLTTWASIGAIAHAVSGPGVSPAAARPWKHVPGFTEALTVLVLVNAVFLSFVVLQFGYLFSGAQRVSSVPASAYTEYVHNGFGQLICVAVIAIALISGLCANVAPETIDWGRRRSILNGSGLVLLCLTLVILFSAAQRMGVYETVYGATAMRIYVDDFILFVALALLWRGVTLYAGSDRAPSFGAGVLACVVGLGAALNLQNPEAAAVQTNLARYRATGKVDNHFFEQPVSADAVHSLCAAFRATSGETHADIGLRLRLTLDDLETQRPLDKWPSWHAGRAAAREDLMRVELSLPSEKDARRMLSTSVSNGTVQ